MISKVFNLFLVTLFCAQSPAMERGESYSLTTISFYKEVEERVQSLVDQGIQPKDILVITDWDDTINGPGAWLQKDYQGNYFNDERRILTEEEVDHRHRDGDTPKILRKFRENGTPTVVATARPPIRDLHLIEHAENDHGVIDLLDLRHPEDEHQIHYDEICSVIKTIVHSHEEELLLEKTRHKVEIMEERSGINLTGQHTLDYSFASFVGNDKLVYHDGYAFVGHNKGPAVVELLTKINKFLPHIIIVDDSDSAMISYKTVVGKFSQKGSFLHLLHYPKG